MNKEVVIFASAARTETANSAVLKNQRCRGGLFTLDITAASGSSPTLDVKIQMKDRTSGKFIDIPDCAFAQKTTTGTSRLLLYPGVPESANAEVADVLPEDFRAVATIGGGTPSFTFTLAVDLLL